MTSTPALAALPSMARNHHPKLVAHLETLCADGAGNRTPILTMVLMASTPDRAQMLLETLEAQNFLDPVRSGDDERADRYAWDLALNAVEVWATLAQQPETIGVSNSREPNARATHLTSCALSSSLSNWLLESERALHPAPNWTFADDVSTELQALQDPLADFEAAGATVQERRAFMAGCAHTLRWAQERMNRDEDGVTLRPTLFFISGATNELPS